MYIEEMILIGEHSQKSSTKKAKRRVLITTFKISLRNLVDGRNRTFYSQIWI